MLEVLGSHSSASSLARASSHVRRLPLFDNTAQKSFRTALLEDVSCSDASGFVDT